MGKYIFDVLESEKFSAGTKAKNDISFYLHEQGFLKIFIDKDMGRFEKYLFANTLLNKKLSGLGQSDLLIVQYPLYMGKLYTNILIRKLKKINIPTVLIVHDVEAIREHFNDPEAIKKEVTLLNQFDLLIVHNNQMKNWLKESGVNREMIDLSIFDYYNQQPYKRMKHDKQISIAFAGNLEKSLFLTKISKSQETIYNLYGPNPQESIVQKMSYKGTYPPEILPLYLEGNYGLVWDGESLNTCTGKYGNYMRYNNPHKTSLYLSCGIPVIIWKQAALASFIEKNGLGLAVNSLEDIDEQLMSITEEQYDNMVNNVVRMSEKIRNGYFIQHAVQQAEQILKRGVKNDL